MTQTAAHPLAQVAELDEERRRYESWLDQLDARRDAGPEHVYARVRADYEGRLQAVLARLAEHAETLRHAVDELSGRVADLQAQEQHRLDERAEAELRTLVGEYTAEQWHDIQAVADEELAHLGGQRAAAEQELVQLQDMLARAGAAVTPPPAPPAPEPVMPVVPAVEPRTRTPVTTPVTAAAVPLEPLPLVPLGDEPLLETPPPPPAAPAPRADVRPPEADVTPPADEVFASWSRGLDDGSAAGLGRTPTPTEGAAFAASGDDASPQIKTLKCQECGTMNYPTEWYCERCGGELAAL